MNEIMSVNISGGRAEEFHRGLPSPHHSDRGRGFVLCDSDGETAAAALESESGDANRAAGCGQLQHQQPQMDSLGRRRRDEIIVGRVIRKRLVKQHCCGHQRHQRRYSHAITAAQSPCTGAAAGIFRPPLCTDRDTSPRRSEYSVSKLTN